jgi:RNAse (barnase) inhibitor barstar
MPSAASYVEQKKNRGDRFNNHYLKITNMAHFPDDINFLHGRLDWAVLQNGWSSLYCREDILEKDLLWFRDANFSVIEMDCLGWTNMDVIHASLRTALDFPDYYGNNWDALNDCLSDVAILEEGLVVVLRHFDQVKSEWGLHIADIFANNSRRHLLFGRKLILLMQVSSRKFELPKVGGCPVVWNAREFFIGK